MKVRVEAWRMRDGLWSFVSGTVELDIKEGDDVEVLRMVVEDAQLAKYLLEATR